MIDEKPAPIIPIGETEPVRAILRPALLQGGWTSEAVAVAREWGRERRHAAASENKEPCGDGRGDQL